MNQSLNPSMVSVQHIINTRTICPTLGKAMLTKLMMQVDYPATISEYRRTTSETFRNSFIIQTFSHI